MKLTLANIKELKRNSNSPLTKRVCNYVIGEWSDYSDKKNIFTDVLYHGCQSGIVGEEINSLLYDTMNGTGLYSPSELFGDKWDKEDPLAQDTYNQNLLAWFGFEETLRNIGYNFEKLENYIYGENDYENDYHQERKSNRNHEENGYLQAVYKRI